MNVGKKLYISYFSILIFLGVIFAVNSIGLQLVRNDANLIISDAIPIGEAADSILTEIINEETGVRGYLISEDERFLEPYKNGKENIVELLSVIDSYTKNHPIMGELIAEAKPKISKIEEYFESQIKLVQENKTEEARLKVGDGKELIDDYRELHIEIENDITKLTNDSWEKVNQAKDFSLFISIVIFGVAVFITLVISFFMNKSISKPINEVSKVLHRVSMGELNIELLKVHSKDEIGILTDSLNKMVVNMRNILLQVNDVASQLAASSEELSASSEQSSIANEQIAQSTQKSAEGAKHQLDMINREVDVINNISGSLSEISNSSNEMYTLSKKTLTASVDGIDTVKNVVTQMQDISDTVNNSEIVIKKLGEHSKEIGNMVAIIESITEQTNLLSLNAAIEAARAGEQGKGFAVVADEIRQLAEQSKTSAMQIESFVKEIQLETEQAVKSINLGNEKVKDGFIKTQHVSETFQKIKDDVTNVNTKVEGVIGAIKEVTKQSLTIVDVSSELESVAKESAILSQENSASNEEQVATMEEITSSAQSLAELADHLLQSISIFKL